MGDDRANRPGWGRGRWRALGLAGAGFALALCGCDGACDLTEAVRKIAGPGAMDCGYARLETDGTAINACALAAISSGQPFVTRYERGLVGTEEARARAATPLVDGLGRSPDGRLWVADMTCQDPDCRAGAYVQRICVNEYTVLPIDCARGECKAPVVCSLWKMGNTASCGE